MGSVNPGQVVLGGVRKQVEQALGSNLVNRIPPMVSACFCLQDPALTFFIDDL